MRTVLLSSAASFAVTAGIASAQSLMVPVGDGDFNWDSYEALKQVDLSGEQLTVFGPWLGPDQELIESVLDYFREATGADVRYTGSDGFEQQIMVDLEGGSPPNIAIFPQPGLAADMARRGFLTPLPDHRKTLMKC